MAIDERMPPYRFSHRARVGFDETDAQGIVYYGRYMPYFDRARVEYLRHLGVLVREPSDPEFVMRAQHVEYLAPARFDDELDVFVRVRRIGTTSIVWEFEAHEVATGIRKLDLSSGGAYLRSVISIKATKNPIYWTTFVLLASPRRWLVRNLLQVWYRFGMGLLKALRNPTPTP